MLIKSLSPAFGLLLSNLYNSCGASSPHFPLGQVHQLSADNFSDTLKLFDVSMVKFHTPCTT